MKILVIRFSSIGDIVLCTPVFRVLAQKYPEAEFHFLTKSNFSQLIASLPSIHYTWSWDQVDERKRLWSMEFDLIIDLHQNLRSMLVKSRFWYVPSFTFRKSNFYKFFFTFTKNKRFEVTPIVQRYMQILGNLGIHYDGKGLDFPLNKADKIESFESEYGVVVLGGTYATKRIPQEKLAEFFAKTANKKWILIGGKVEMDMGKRLAAQFYPWVESKAGELSIAQSATVIAGSKVVLSGDTGMAHIAAALGKPVGVVWGNTAPGYGMSPEPKYPNQIQWFEPENLSCWPCHKLGYGACPKQHFSCMQAQKTEHWKNFTEKYL